MTTGDKRSQRTALIPGSSHEHRVMCDLMRELFGVTLQKQHEQSQRVVDQERSIRIGHEAQVHARDSCALIM